MPPSNTLLTLLACAGLIGTAATESNGTTISCNDIPPPNIPGADIVAFSAQEMLNVSGPTVDEPSASTGYIEGLNICNVVTILSHPGVGDRVEFHVWLPLDGWNGRFMATGGAAYLGGLPGTQGLGTPVKDGFAAGMTDGGGISEGGEYLNPDMIQSTGAFDLGRFADFSSRSLHELALVGKAVTESFYQSPPSYSYWYGCSNGGRQGYTVAQKHPGDFDGIVANAPALYWPSLLVALGWVQFTMRWLNHQVPLCVLNEFSQASVKACDGLDGVIDDVISNPDACNFDPYSIVGNKANCTPTEATITDKDAQVVEAIMGGPRSPQGTKLWETWHWGTDYTTLASPPESLNLWDSWIRIAVNKDAGYDINNYRNLSQLVDHFAVSQAEFDGLIGTNDPDLSAFRDRGGKLLTWHGMADGIIPANNTVRYRREVEQVMGGNSLVDDFYRLFLVPGAGHCNAGNGAYPADALDSLIAWVEEGKVPDTLHGEINDGKGSPAERIMCPYPHVARYDGKGNAREATSYTCAKEHARAVEGRDY